MIEKELLDLLVCPLNNTPLKVADEALIERLNRAIAGKTIVVKNRGGRLIEEPLAGGLVRRDEALLYPIVDDIPVLLVDKAIPLEQIP